MGLDPAAHRPHVLNQEPPAFEQLSGRRQRPPEQGNHAEHRQQNCIEPATTAIGIGARARILPARRTRIAAQRHRRNAIQGSGN